MVAILSRLERRRSFALKVSFCAAGLTNGLSGALYYSKKWPWDIFVLAIYISYMTSKGYAQSWDIGAMIHPGAPQSTTSFMQEFDAV
jgi:hypothetical protein